MPELDTDSVASLRHLDEGLADALKADGLLGGATDARLLRRLGFSD